MIINQNGILISCSSMIMKEMCERPNHPCGWAGKPRANGGRPPQIPGFGITNFLVGRVAEGKGGDKRRK